MSTTSEQELGSTAVEKVGSAPIERPSGESLVRFAIEKDVPVEVLERLVALEERMAERHARAAFFDALAAFQSECPLIEKPRTATVTTKSGSKFSYDYAPLGVIVDTVRPILYAHGLSYAWDSRVNGDGITVVCKLRHVDGHTETARFEAPTGAKTEAMSAQQEVGAALTYGKRQSLTQVLGIATEDDVDGKGGRPAKGNAKPITEKQVADLRAKIQEVGADEARFCRWLKVDALENLPTHKLHVAVKGLEDKRRSG